MEYVMRFFEINHRKEFEYEQKSKKHTRYL